MIDELFAYFYGRSVGREQGARVRRKRRRMTVNDAAHERALLMFFIFAAFIAVVAVLVGH